MAPTDSEEWTVERHLCARPPAVVALYHRFVELAEDCGPFTYAVARTAITFKGPRRGFAGLSPGPRHLAGHLDLRHRAAHDRTPRSAPYPNRLRVHHFRITELAQLDDAFAALLRAAYEVGSGAHLGAAGGAPARGPLGQPAARASLED
ncbi:DUF5655 domain-containing protein [Streptomyces sp. NBC_01497]|uniref:DUF5655 domain-containing protein n=1 Tax=Streptomyces sp. NBC_01497 TaxID=2903885 RepID=UPI002E37A0AF|nr:DUF5655 domain-containing protein [Streptomyces sp. NBC_01497]